MMEGAPPNRRTGGSTGPRTREGKARSSQNARKHGLSATTAASEMETETNRLAKIIAAELPADAAVSEAVQAVAAAQGYVARVRALKTEMMQADPLIPTREGSLEESAPPPRRELLQRLERLERYERRAFSQRKSAIRHLVSLLKGLEHA